MTTTKQIAAQLDGVEYPAEVSASVEAAAKQNGIVIVFGASDDLMEFRGAIDDEVGCYNGGAAHLTRSGLLANECDNEDCPHFARLKKSATQIRALWSPGDGYSWLYDAPFPHETFEVKEDGQPYCRGIVFRLADIPEVSR